MIEFIELSTPIMGFTPTVQWNALVSDIDAAILNLFEKIDANSNSNYDNLRDWKNVDKPIWDTFVGVVKKANVYLTPSNGVRTNRDFIRDLLVKTLMAMYDVQLRVETIKIDEDDDDEESDSTDDTKPSIANDLLSGDFAYLLGTTKSLRKLANQLASLKNFKLTSGMAEELALHLVSLNRSQTKITGFINAVHNLAGEDEEVDEEVDEVVDDADF
jgi:hypothetical protein